MNTIRFSALASLLLTTAPVWAQSPSYVKQVKPFLAKYCLECHNAEQAKGDLVLDSVREMLAGGKSGPALVPGKPDESRLVLLAEGKEKPAMPPKNARQPLPGEAAVLRAWVAGGAKEDGGKVIAAIPAIKPKKPQPPAVTALAYRPDGRQLAAATHRQVILIDPATGEAATTLPELPARVTALAYRPDGQAFAVASGTAGNAGEILYYDLSATTPSLVRRLPAHKDMIHQIVFSPDGKLLASGGYDRLIKLWDAASGKELRTLKDHSDAVYALAFSPDGKLLASAAADRAVKVWDVNTGSRLYTLSEATDWLYAVAWSPEGHSLAAAGVDKSIRVWEVTPQGGRITHSVFAHERPVLRLSYAADGKTLYSLGEDRVVKAWERTSMTERRVYPAQSEAVLALAIRPDQKQLALGRFDGKALLLEEATGKVQSEPLPIKPKPPQLVKLTPSTAKRGQTVRVIFEGKHLEPLTAIVADHPGVTTKLIAGTASAEVTFPADTPAGNYKLGVKTAVGEAALPFTVDLFDATVEHEPDDTLSSAQRIAVPTSIAGTLHRPGDTDFYRFTARAGQPIGVLVQGTKTDPEIRLLTPAGQTVAEGTQGLLGYTCPKAGDYLLAIHDRDYRGGADFSYRLHLGAVPIVTAVHPLGVQRGQTATVQLEGVFLSQQAATVMVPGDAALGSRVPVAVTSTHGKVLGNPMVTVGEFPELVAGNSNTLPVPGTGNGRLVQPGAADTWRFAGRQGQRLIVEVHARRLGSPLDSMIEILDERGQPVPRATLRCLARTYTTFRDHDSSLPGIRLDAWSELGVNDYLYSDGELIRIDALPKNPDDDCRFYSINNQRLGFLDTTPRHHPLGEPLYKVSIHPPGTKFPPNGFPVITLDYRNDDGGPGYGKDSRVFFDPPRDGTYQVRITDARGAAGANYGYRLTVRPRRPGFTVSFSPQTPSVGKGSGVALTVTATRVDDYQGPIALSFENLPPGFKAPATTIPIEETRTSVTLFADNEAEVPAKAPSLKLIARALIDGKEVRQEVTGGLPKLVDPGDLLTRTDQQEITLKPGGEVRLTATIERRNKFNGRVPLDVMGLPHGVRVLDIGLNGILITPGETKRTMVLYAEPWVQPMTHPFVVLSRREGKGTEHAAPSVLLRIQP